jgi:hypothetical protein
MPVYYTHIGRNLDLVAPKHDTTVGATVTVVAEENVAVDCKNMGSVAGILVSRIASHRKRDANAISQSRPPSSASVPSSQ